MALVLVCEVKEPFGWSLDRPPLRAGELGALSTQAEGLPCQVYMFGWIGGMVGVWQPDEHLHADQLLFVNAQEMHLVADLAEGPHLINQLIRIRLTEGGS